MKTRKSLIGFILISILLAVGTVVAQNGAITVKCVDAAGAPASGAKVQIQALPGGKWIDRKSDKNGLAEYKKLPDGLYRILGRKEGCDPAFHEFLLIKGAENTQTTTLTFKAGNPLTKVYFEDPSIDQKSMQALQDGVNFLRESKFAEAEKKILESIEIHPSNPDAYMNLAITYIQMRQWEKGAEALQTGRKLVDYFIVLQPPKAATEGPSPIQQLAQRFDEILTKIPIFRLREEGDRALREKRFDEAADKYQKAIEADPSDTDLNYNLGLALANGKKYDEAMLAIDKALKAKPQEKDYLELKKQIAYFKENEMLAKARTILDEADKLFNAQDFPAALKKYEEARPMIPENRQGIIYVQIARCFGQLKQSEAAVTAYKKAIELTPDNQDYRRQLAQFYLKEKKYEEALNLYAESGSGGQTELTLFNLGKTQSNQSNSEVAILAFERLIKLNPQYAEAYYELGMVYYDKKEYPKAKEILEKYLSLAKDPAHIDNSKSVIVVIDKLTKKK